MKKDNKPTKKYKRKSGFGYDFVKITGFIPVYLWLRPRIIYAGDKKKSKPKKGVLIIANHGTFYDPLIMFFAFWYRRLHMLATKDLYKNKALTFLFNHTLCIQVDKENFSMNSFHEAVARLKDDRAVMMFPEGRVTHGGEHIEQFKDGAALMAHLSGKPILPVFLAGAKKWYNRCVAIIGEPIDVREICPGVPNLDGLKKISEVLREKEQELANLYIEKYSKNKEKNDEQN